MRRPVLLLDVMDTLVHDPFYVEVLDFFGMPLEQLFANKSKTAWSEFERGHISEAQLEARYFDDERPLDLYGLRDCMRDNYRLLPGVEALLDELVANGYALHALSNYPMWYELVEAATGLSRWLQWSFVSCKTQVRKPKPEAYLGAARTLGVSASECIFVDDREKNCAAARDVGMPSIRFTDVPQLRRELLALGVELQAPDAS